MVKIDVESIGQQIQRNAVALISLAIALASLGYNTWRNETTEHQRNTRHAAFEIVEQLGELQANANQLAYFGETGNNSAWNQGWGNVLSIRTLGQLLSGDVPAETESLFQVWSEQVGSLDAEDSTRRDAADRAVTEQIRRTNQAVIDLLRGLD
ncbi:MAG: hypothetical protein QNJ40_08765 [Xanthomonadales bacterium]|nr:hypothetical protein [Xanthomonadales bacterium]